MKVYDCIRQVHATPMSREDYNEYRDWVLPVDEDGSDEGYLIVYNKDTDDHYEAWNPKHIFDEGYAEVQEMV